MTAIWEKSTSCSGAPLKRYSASVNHVTEPSTAEPESLSPQAVGRTIATSHAQRTNPASRACQLDRSGSIRPLERRRKVSATVYRSGQPREGEGGKEAPP